MLKITEKDRIARYREMDEPIRELYVSDVISNVIENKYQNYDTPEIYQVIGDTILGFYKTVELPRLFQKEFGVSADDAQRILSDLTSFLEPVVVREKEEMQAVPNSLDELQATFTPTVNEPKPAEEDASLEATPPVEQEPQTTPDAPSHTTVQPMRTMESDMSRIHGYGAYRSQFPDELQEVKHKEEVIRSASQEELLTEKPQLTDMPHYKEDQEE